MKLELTVLLGLVAGFGGYVAAQTNGNNEQGSQQYVWTYDETTTQAPSTEAPAEGYSYVYVDEDGVEAGAADGQEEKEDVDVPKVDVKLPSAAQLKEMVSKKQITADFLNGVEKNVISLVCTCKGSFKDGDSFSIDHLFKGSETREQTCEEVCGDIKKQSNQQTRVKRQLGLFGWNAYPNFGYGGYFGGLPIGYGGLGFNLMGAWAGLGGANYGCVANRCGGFGGCHFGCARTWLPRPMPTVVRSIPVPRPFAVPVARPYAVPVPRPVDVPVIRRVDVPVPRAVPVPRPVDVPVVRRVDVPVVRQINVARPVPVPLPVVKPVSVPVAKPYAVAVPQPVVVPVQRRLIVKKRLLYRPAVARVSGVALVPVQGVAARRMAASGIAGTGMIGNLGALGAAYRRGGAAYSTGYSTGGIPVPAGGGYYTSGARSYRYPQAAATTQ